MKIRRLVLRSQANCECDYPSEWRLRLQGEHNRYNFGLAVAAARALGVADEAIKAVAENFAGVPGRLELVAEKNSISFYNDTTATTPDATRADHARDPRKK